LSCANRLTVPIRNDRPNIRVMIFFISRVSYRLSEAISITSALSFQP
jgi:hypothetical protein